MSEAHDDVIVRLPGGALVVRVPRGDAPVLMTGPARRVFTGEVAAPSPGAIATP